MKTTVGFCMVLLLAACSGEHREARLYGPQAAQHAGDTAPWQGPAFNGDSVAWDHQMDKRARLQNEYARIR
ncbi:MAG TPA: hypothetical protein VFZ14_00480 [Burkholderiales bacterium]|nr:hypothetical protein [Burkholderiales bacterium]